MQRSFNTMDRLMGMALVVISAAAFGTLGILGRYAYADGIDTTTILFFRFTLAALALAAYQLIRRHAIPRGRTLVQLVGMGAIGYVGQAFCYLTALKYASPGLVALLLYLYPAIVVILSALWLGERITGVKIAALVMALVGLTLTVGPEGGQAAGILLGIGAALIYSLYILVGAQAMKQVTAVQSSTVIFASAGAMSALLMMVNGPQLPSSPLGWSAIGLIVVAATILPVVAFLVGLERIGPTNAAMLSTSEPVVTVLLAALLLGEGLSPISLLGGGLILAAVLLLTSSELRRRWIQRAAATP